MESPMDEIHRLINIGHWIAATKLYNDIYKTGLKRAKEYVDKLRKQS